MTMSNIPSGKAEISCRRIDGDQATDALLREMEPLRHLIGTPEEQMAWIPDTSLVVTFEDAFPRRWWRPWEFLRRRIPTQRFPAPYWFLYLCGGVRVVAHPRKLAELKDRIMAMFPPIEAKERT